MKALETGAVAAYDAIADVYDQQFRSALALAEDDVISGWVLDFLREHAARRVLDVGCGTGWLLDRFPFMTSSGYVGIDASAGMISVARRKWPDHEFHQWRVEELRGGGFTIGPEMDAAVSLYGVLSGPDAPGRLVEMCRSIARG